MRQAATDRSSAGCAGEDAHSTTTEFLTAYLLTLNQLNEIRSRVDDARNDQERRASLVHLRNARTRCSVLQSLVFPAVFPPDA